MKSTSKRSQNSCKNDEKDRLSELPDEILVHILSFLPIVDAVRTLIIRRFGNLWTLLPSLEFDDKEFWKAYKKIRKHANSNFEEFRLVFANFVQNVLILHKGHRIHRFKLTFYLGKLYHGYNKLFINEVTTWLGFAIDREVKDLEVVWVRGSIVSRCLFSSQFLVTLMLSDCRIIEPSKVHMRSLKELSLEKVEMSNEMFNMIVQGTPSLQELSLNRVTGLDELRFTAPNIQKLSLVSFHGLLHCPNLKILVICTDNIVPQKMGDLSSICEVNIRSTYHPNANAFFSKFCHAEVFKFSGGIIPFYKFKEAYIPQTRWKCLRFKSWSCGDNFLAICKLLRSSPHLEELDVCIDSPHLGIDDNNLSLELSSFVMQHLKTVTLCGYKLPCHGLLQLAGLLLKNSVILEKMAILPSNGLSAAVDVLNFWKKLISFPRASTNARVIFGSDF